MSSNEFKMLNGFDWEEVYKREQIKQEARRSDAKVKWNELVSLKDIHQAKFIDFVDGLRLFFTDRQFDFLINAYDSIIGDYWGDKFSDMWAELEKEPKFIELVKEYCINEKRGQDLICEIHDEVFETWSDTPFNPYANLPFEAQVILIHRGV